MRVFLIASILFLLIACQPAVQPRANATISDCNPPYYEYEKGDCCLDKDTNKVCDRDEQTAAPITGAITAEPETSEMSKVIAKFRQNVDSYTYKIGDTEYLARGKLVHVKLDKFKELPLKINNTIRVHITDIFIDRETTKATGYCDLRSEEEIVGELNADRSKCIKINDMPFTLAYDEYNPFLPEDWLSRFANAKPILVEDTDQYVKQESGWKAVNPVLHFQEGNTEFILRIDSKYGIPLRVEQRIDDKTTAQEYNQVIYDTIKPAELIYQPFHK